MRICTEIATGKLIEAQSGEAEPGALLANAVAAGYAPNDIEERVVESAEYRTLLDATQPEPTYRQRRARDYAAELGQEPGQISAIGDTLDTILKQFNQQRLDGAPMIQEMDDLLAAVLTIKARHPKP